MLAANAPAGQIDETFDAREWLSDPRNVALRSGADLAMFEHVGTHTFLGHVFFASRGREATAKAQAMLVEMFEAGAWRIIGEIPAYRRDVRLFMGRLGFKAIGQAMRPQGRVIVVELQRGNCAEQPLHGMIEAVPARQQV